MDTKRDDIRARAFTDLPRRRVTAVSKGFSGEGYEGWVEEPAQRVRISDVRMVDLAEAAPVEFGDEIWPRQWIYAKNRRQSLLRPMATPTISLPHN